MRCTPRFPLLIPLSVLLAELRIPRTRSTIVGAVIFSMLGLLCAPVVSPADRLDDSAAEWLRRQLRIPADDSFHRAADAARAAGPTSLDEFVRQFVVAYDASELILERLAWAFGHPEDPFSLIGSAARILDKALAKRHREGIDVKHKLVAPGAASLEPFALLRESIRPPVSSSEGYVAGSMIRLLITASPEGP